MGGMSPEYFKQRLRPHEASAYVEGIAARSRERWEHTRMAAYCSLAPWIKDLKITDVMKFAWDNEPEEMTDEKYNNLLEWANTSLDLINKIDGRHRSKA